MRRNFPLQPHVMRHIMATLLIVIAVFLTACSGGSSGGGKNTSTPPPKSTDTVPPPPPPPPTDEEIVAAARFEVIFSGDDSIARVTGDIELPSISDNGVDITWLSKKPDVIDDTGKLLRTPASFENNRIFLTATLTKGDVTVEKDLIVWVAREAGWVIENHRLVRTDGTVPGSYSALKKLEDEEGMRLVLLPTLGLQRPPVIDDKIVFIAKDLDDESAGYRLWDIDDVTGEVRVILGARFEADELFNWEIRGDKLYFAQLYTETETVCSETFDVERRRYFRYEVVGGDGQLIGTLDAPTGRECPPDGYTEEEWADDDDDGLRNIFEAEAGTNPNNPDSDGDGWTDGYEYWTSKTDPLKKDTDGDGLEDPADSLPLTPNNIVLIHVPDLVLVFKQDIIYDLQDFFPEIDVSITHADGTLNPSEFASAVLDFGDALLPFLRSHLNKPLSSDADVKSGELQVNEYLTDYLNMLEKGVGAPTRKEIGDRIRSDAGFRMALSGPLAGIYKQVLINGDIDTLSAVQKKLLARIATNINDYRTKLGLELQRQHQAWAAQNAITPFSLKTMPDIAISSQEATTQLAVGAAIGAGAGVVVGAVAFASVSAAATSIFPFAAAGTAAIVAGAGGAAAIGGIAVAGVVVGVISVVMLVQEAENKQAFDNMVARSKVKVNENTLSPLKMNNDQDLADFLIGFTMTVGEVRPGSATPL